MVMTVTANPCASEGSCQQLFWQVRQHEFWQTTRKNTVISLIADVVHCFVVPSCCSNFESIDKNKPLARNQWAIQTSPKPSAFHQWLVIVAPPFPKSHFTRFVSSHEGVPSILANSKIIILATFWKFDATRGRACLFALTCSTQDKEKEGPLTCLPRRCLNLIDQFAFGSILKRVYNLTAPSWSRKEVSLLDHDHGEKAFNVGTRPG